MDRNRKTVADMLALKGKRQISMLFVDKVEEAAAASEAGIDMLSIISPVWTPEMRAAAGKCFVQVGLIYGDQCTYEDYLRAAHAGIKLGGDCFYCAASLDTISKLSAEGIPVVGHVGLIPARNTWTGGFKAVGKSADAALELFEAVKNYEAAGAFGAEIEVVPVEVASAISARTSLIMLSMGAGSGCDAQYLFAEDVLGQNRGHMPRHSKVYRNFAAEFDRLQQERIAAFSEFVADVGSSAYPEERHIVRMDPGELGAFMEAIDRQA
jgi:3-methyl-2-oxobutanoate hydroxymethyltransferase